MPDTITALKAINSTSPITWSEFIRALPDRPVAYIERSVWRELLQTVGALGDMELITVVRDKTSNDVLSLALTDLGLERLREAQDSERLCVERRENRMEKDRLGIRPQRPRGLAS